MLEITPTDISEILKYVFDLFSDFKLLIFLVIGMFLGFWIIREILDAIIIYRGGTPKSWIMRKYGGTAEDEEEDE